MNSTSSYEDLVINPIADHFLAKVILIAFVGLILNPWSASLADVDCSAPSNSTKAISARPGTRRTSLNPGNYGNK